MAKHGLEKIAGRRAVQIEETKNDEWNIGVVS